MHRAAKSDHRPNLDLFEVESPSKRIQREFHPRIVEIDGVALTTTPAFDAYWYFAQARQNVFFERVTGVKVQSNLPEDQIIKSYRFTNAYRASDRVSQYLIQNVIGAGQTNWSERDLFIRILLFKIFNKIETWESLVAECGEPNATSFDFELADQVLSDRQDKHLANYSAAYIMPSAGRVFGFKRKHSNHLALIKWMLEEQFAERLRSMCHMKDAYELILSAPSIGPFLAYQFVTDLNYSDLTDYSEMEFVVAGPGAHDGISKCFENSDSVRSESVIRYMTENQAKYFSEFGYKFRDLWGRPLQLIDCQNLFCEISKYTRVAFPDIEGVSGRTRIKQSYTRSRRTMYNPVYPAKWGIKVPHAAHGLTEANSTLPH